MAITNLFAEGRYRVVHKLGFGGSSTIWLAREQHGGQSYASIPIKEIIPQSLSSLVLGAKIQIPQDYFMEDGPNGSHLCSVYQPAGPRILPMTFVQEGS